MKRLKNHPIFIREINGILVYCREHNGSPAFWAGNFDYQSFPSEVTQDLLTDVAETLGISEVEVGDKLMVRSQTN